MRRSPATLEERFWKHVDKSGDCWLWKGEVTSRGYGKLCSYKIFEGRRRKTTVRAHRLSYEIANGAIPEGMFVCHKCDTPLCVNPNHLFAGTPTDNARDRDAKGRGVTPGRSGLVKGENHGMSRLKDDQIREMRKLFESGLRVSEIAKDFGLYHSTARKIVLREAWKHVE